MRKVLLFGLLLVVSLPIACTQDMDRTQAASEAKMTDSELQSKVEAAIRTDSPATTQLDVDANADRNMVTLTGTVETEGQRTQIVQMARNSHPGLIVEDKIDVKPRELTRDQYTEEHARLERDKAKERHETIGSSLDDAWIHAKIVTKLVGNSDTPERTINVDVNNGTVTLRGTVDTTTAKTEAETVAKETEGVKRVNNQLKVTAAKAY
jgi:osmotically-inducible protein OsmY